MKLNHNK